MVYFELLDGYKSDHLICILVNNYYDVKFKYANYDLMSEEDLRSYYYDTDEFNIAYDRLKDHFMKEIGASFETFLNHICNNPNMEGYSLRYISDIHILMVNSLCLCGIDVPYEFFMLPSVIMDNKRSEICNDMLGNAKFHIYTAHDDNFCTVSEILGDDILGDKESIYIHKEEEVIIDGRYEIKIFYLDEFDNIKRVETIRK